MNLNGFYTYNKPFTVFGVSAFYGASSCVIQLTFECSGVATGAHICFFLLQQPPSREEGQSLEHKSQVP